MPAPDLSEGTWLNTDAKSLLDFRGKYVLLDFWFIGCGPCHRDMPTVKMAHRVFSDREFSVVSVHINSQTPGNVQQFAASNGMTYPIVVDNVEGSILERYQELGVRYYPSYILVGPDGNVLINDSVPVPGNLRLRMDKIEAIYHALDAGSTTR